MMFHAEIVYRNGAAVGYIRAASYGHTLGGAVGLAMIEAGEPIDQAYVAAGEWTVDIAGRRYPARASIKALYDPGKITVPTLLLHAGDFGLVREEQVDAYRLALGDLVEIVEVPGGHMVYWDAYEETADALERFLDAG